MNTRVAAIDYGAAIQAAPRASRNDRIIYWATTGIVAAVMLSSALTFAFDPAMKDAFAHFGLANWFRVELTTAKILGALALLIPQTPHRIKEFAYCGFAITLISASIAHLSSGDPLSYEIGHSIFFVSLVISYLYYHKRISGTAAL